MVKTLTAAALMGAMTFATVPGLTSAAFAQAAGPEPMQGATPMDNGGGAMSKGSGDQGAMGGQDSMSKKKMSKHKKHMKHSKKSM